MVVRTRSECSLLLAGWLRGWSIERHAALGWHVWRLLAKLLALLEQDLGNVAARILWQMRSPRWPPSAFSVFPAVDM